MVNRQPVVAVVGGGAAGLCAAIEAAKAGAETVLLEAMPRCGKKILATGNGRCNLSNADTALSHYHGAVGLIDSVFRRYSPSSAEDFFRSLGVFLRTDGAGRIYPLSSQASAVLDALRFEAERLGVEIRNDCKVSSIEKKENGWLLNGSVYAGAVVLACGGKAAPVHGSDGSGYALVRSLGVPLTPVFPALTGIVIDNFTKSLKGIRAEGTVSVRCNGKISAESTGEIQYTDYGLSGIPAMQVSRAVSAHFAMNTPGTLTVVVDRSPSLSAEELASYILSAIRARPSLLCEDLLTGIMPKRLGMTVMTDVSLSPQKPLSAVYPGTVDAIVQCIKSKKYKVKSVLGFQDAQVTAGGIAESAIVPDTLELKKCPGVFVCGELVDVDGDCGGYNLLWAWNSGRLAGYNAALYAPKK